MLCGPFEGWFWDGLVDLCVWSFQAQSLLPPSSYDQKHFSPTTVALRLLSIRVPFPRSAGPTSFETYWPIGLGQNFTGLGRLAMSSVAF